MPCRKSCLQQENRPQMAKPPNKDSSYTHDDQAVQRPDVGVQAEFSGAGQPKQYRYDSSMAPELSFDENAGRDLAEWLLNLIATAAEEGESKVFREPQKWHGGGG